MWSEIFVCLLIAGFAKGSGNSLKDPYICGPPACADAEKFKYFTEVNYHYQYKVNIETYFAGSTNNRSTLDVKALAKVEFITPCEGLLQLSDVKLADQDENYPIERAEKFIQAVSQYDLRFAFHDGLISEICPEEEEEPWVLNFKRGILSLFQNSMKRFDINFKGIEQDIHGTCNVDYSVRGQENTSLILVKTRDLSQCTDRYKYMSILQTVRYNFQSKFQTWPVLKSESKCRITIDHNIYKMVNCKERHLFEPFSGKNSGAMTTVIQDLELISEVNKTDTQIMDSQPKVWSIIQKRANILHYHTPLLKAETGELKSARDVLKLLCMAKANLDDLTRAATIDDNMDSGSTVGLWGRLVRAARPLHYPALSQLLNRANTICDVASKHILDALPYIASTGSVELIKDMIIKKSIDDETRHEWLMSMAMIPRPKKEMLNSMLELLTTQKNDKAVSFTVSSMVHSYCKHSGKSLRECCEEETPRKILEEFQNIVITISNTGIVNGTRPDRNNILIALKALGNIGGFKLEFADVLMDLIGNSIIPVPVRLTAIDAFRRTPCVETREYFLETFRGDYVNVEIRIASYLQMMRCPNLSTVRKIFHALKNEPVNQVATFVWSHLNNIGQSSLPSRVEIQGLLSGNPMPQLEDSPDFRMFSRNYEQGVFFDQFNAGGNYEANVIFSPDSYIPRSVSLNLTVDMFGESINVLELKARGEGFERYFESIFGNNGPLSKANINEHINKIRNIRSPSDSDSYQAKIDNLGYKNEALKHRFPMAELGIKVFGNEISFWNAEGDEEIRKSLMKLDPKLRIMEILSGKEISYNKASLFLDTTFSVATGSGLPLNMNLMGTSYVNTKMSGTVANPRGGNTTFEGKVSPSVAINIAATMGVLAGGHSSCGIRINSRMYTATGMEAKISLHSPSLLRVQLSFVPDKREIFAAKSELIILHGDKEVQQQGLNKNRIEQSTCSWSTFDKAIGIKVCAAYQFPNMTNLRNAPYFIMSGPAKYILSLEKADPSAKTYVFEYKWDKNATANVIGFSFDTPDSNEKRMFNAILSLTNTSSTAVVSFQSAENTLKAVALYRNLPYDKSLEASLNVDGKKQFDTQMSLIRHDIKNGFVWQPHAYWVVNDERIAELSGDFKVRSKGGVTQWDISAEFQTKSLASRLIGYHTINGPSHGTKLQLDYQFYMNPKQTIKLDGLYSERSMGYRHDLYGELSMEFTAYPVYNFFAILKNVRTQSHVDINFNVSSSRATKLDPNLNFAFTRIDKITGMKLDTKLIVTRPKVVKMKFKFEEMGPKYSALAVLNFSPKSRDIVVSGYVFYPGGTQLFIDSELNMTLPTLHPCMLKLKVHEKMPREFQVNANGIWFTGIDFNIDALYQDQSKTNMAAHRVKLLVNSDHFKDIAADARFTQDNRQITFVGSADYNEASYRTLLRYILVSEQNFTAFAELGITGKKYSVNLNADMNNNTNVNVDIHFDQLRDIHISYQRWLTDRQKRLSASFNWDANRNPGQKVSVDLQLDNKGPWHHAAYMTLHYPGRLVNADVELLIKDWFCQWHVRTSWSNEANILWRVKMYSEARNETVYALLSNMKTPFNGWTDTSFNVMWRFHDNLQAINGSMNWQEDYLAFSLLADYLFKTNEFYGEISAVVNSTIPTLPKAAAIAKHRVIWKKSAETLLSFQYNEEGRLMINSSWLLDKGRTENNVTGKVTLITPFKGYTKGHLDTHFILGHKKDIKGITYLDLEGKPVKINVDGHMRRITNCMLQVNITSPNDGVAITTARFGFIEADRHLVGMVVTPNSTTGIEVLLKLNSIQDFHVFGHVALPIQYLNRALVTAKRAPKEVDFRVGWGTMDFGFTGIWHYKSTTDFVYLYKLYTPLEGFEENGLVLKNIYGDGLDTEISIRLSKHKFGIAIVFLDNGKGVISALRDRIQYSNATNLFIDNFDTRASVVLDTLYSPTILFNAHLVKYVGVDEEDIMEMNATLHLPDKTAIVLTDVFVLETLATMRNNLHLLTPFPSIQEVKSVYTVDVAIGERFNVTMMALLYNGSYWHEVSYRIFYECETGEDDEYTSHIASINVVTPLDVLPSLQASTSARLEDELWKMAADIEMPTFKVTAKGTLELDDPFVDTSGSLNLTSPYLEDYFIKMDFKKDFSDVENQLGGGILVLQGEQESYISAEALWRPYPNRYIRFKSRFALPPALSPSDILLSLSDVKESTNSIQRSLSAELNSEKIAYSLRADQRESGLNVHVSSPHENYKNVKLMSVFDKNDIKGSIVTDTMEYDVSGVIHSRAPLDVTLTLVPKSQGAPTTIRMKYTHTDTQYSGSAQLTGAVTATVHGDLKLEDSYTDVSVKMDRPSSPAMFVKWRMDSHPEGRKVISMQANTPVEKFSFANGHLDVLLAPKTGFLICKYDLPEMKGDGDLKWSFLLGDLFIKALGHQIVNEAHRSVDLDIYFGNTTLPDGFPKTDAGFRMDLDKVWQIGANASFGVTLDRRINLVINAILPKPNVDVHTLYIDVNMKNDKDLAKTLHAEYRTDVTKIVTGVKGRLLLLPESCDVNTTVTWTSNSQYKIIDNLVSYKWDENESKHIKYELTSPLYKGDLTLALTGSYQKDLVHGSQIVKGLMYKPGKVKIGEVDIRYGGVKRTDGHFNITTPFARLPWLKSIFDIKNLEDHSDNKVDLFWPNKTATVNTTHQYTKLPIGFKQTGVISLSIPLSTQHLVNTEYLYIKGDGDSRGNATIDFDAERFLKGSFNQILTKSATKLDVATTDIEVENAHTPIGIKYIHGYDDTGNTDVKQATVFHLHNATRFNLTGKLDIDTYDIGKNVKLTAIHGNRTWSFENNYEIIEKEMKQGSKVKWTEDIWINYDIHVTNKTTPETESQQLILNVFYPLRTFNLIALYNLQDTLLDGSAVLNWNVKEENKTAELKGRWENPPFDQEGSLHNVDLALSHPSFGKDVTLKGRYITTPLVMSNVSLELQYSDYENEYLKLQSILTDNSNGPIRNYKFALTCTHPSTDLDLDMKSDINIDRKWYYLNNYYRLQKDLLSQKLRSNKLLIDTSKSFVQWERVNETYFYKINGTWDFAYPVYQLVGNAKRPTGNDTAICALDLLNREWKAHYNSSDDISYHSIGKIVDTRSAKLDAWRNYDDVTTVDLSSYIRLNHSRLLTSSIVWRPQIFSEIKSQAVYSLKMLYSQINDTLVIIKEAPMEAHLALRKIWADAKPRVRDFLDDLNDLHVIKDDLDDFELFLNESYNTNDFYVKDIVEFTYYVLDEMAIRNHLESLPGIVNDMWGMMGNTSQSIKQSLTYVVDTIRMAYTNFLQSVNKFMEADFMELVSDRLEAMILQYDTFIRDLHMKLLEYWEETWVNATTRLGKYWHEILKSIEPLFFKVLYYTETFVITVWKSIMDFFYNRTQELTDSPYFNYVSTFGHEMDKIYKDVVNNDVITNIKKYSRKLWNVVWGKIEKYIPFKDEIYQLYAEFKAAWENFLKTEQVVYVREKYKEAYIRLKWWYDYFLIGEALDTVGEILYNKVTDLARTALEYEELHRTPKTNFIFDPKKGEIVLEQKLPMSWHAFNRTPDLSEISEYKTVKDFMDEWVTSNKSLWSYYYEIRPYMDVVNVLPPFAGMAMMTGQGTLVTFDKRVFTVTESGTFLLTKDYRQNNFTVLMQSNDQGMYDLLVVAKKRVIKVDLYGEQVSIGDSTLNLPALIEDVIVDRHTDTITIQGNKGLDVTCNLLFRTCKMQVTGWYYATLGGLLGTYNNEQYDDLQLPNNTLTPSISMLSRGWSIEEFKPPLIHERARPNDMQCEKFFQNKLSPMHPCFTVIDPIPFFEECSVGVNACALAAAYLELCAHLHVPVHIPDQCVQCTTPQGDIIEEGNFHELQYVPNSTDVIFIVEAQFCNKNIRKTKNMDLFVEAFDTKLQAGGYSDNRYAVVGYGGSGLYRVPRSLYVNNKVFTNSIEIAQHFDTMQIAKQDLTRTNRTRHSDIFSALHFATTLPLRPAVPRTVVLIPCTYCDVGVMKLDYSTLYHSLSDNAVTLHILMDGEFTLSKKRVAKYLFGVDSNVAYTNKDYERLVGDAGLRRQVKLPKDKLGVCTSLAMETNGTIFAGAKLQGERGTARRLASVLGAAAARAAPSACSLPRCECRHAALHCATCRTDYTMNDLPFWNTDDIDDLIDMAMDPPTLPSF